jgi:spore coat polysaccharide biosynthesis protein SpsF (cytidylyltransferase family)
MAGGQDKVAIIIQARFGSSRLPGKALMDLGGMPVLAHVIQRCKRVTRAHQIMVATTFEPEAEAIMAIARENGAGAIQGSMEDVLGRYHVAAQGLDAKHIVRITSDCPLIDPGVIDDLIALYFASSADYANNLEPRTYPHGLDCEIFSRALLDKAHGAATEPRMREHVTPWMREIPGIARAHLSQTAKNLAGSRWTLDYPADLNFFRALFDAYPTASTADFRAIDHFLGQAPEVSALNAAHVDQSLLPRAGA